MTHTVTWFGILRCSAPGKLLRALLVAQQLAGFYQMPAVKALSAIASPSEVLRVADARSLTPAGQRIAYPAGPTSGNRPGLCNPVIAPSRGKSQKYHGDLHAHYCDGRSIYRP